MKKVAISGTRGDVRGVSFVDTTTAMRKVGNNCGNLVFQYAVNQLIGEPTEVIGLDTSWNAKEIRNRNRIVVIPSANFLRENLDFSQYVNFLENLELPLVFLGLGAQADDFNKTSFDFHPSVLRLIDLIRERSPRVGVRGEFTARVLDSFGLTNFDITGCPSNFINPDPAFPEIIAKKMAQPLRSFITHADEPWSGKPHKTEVERRLLSWTLHGRSIMVQQSVPRVMEYLRHNNPFSKEEPSENFEASLAKHLMPDGTDVEKFRDIVATRLRTYYSVDQWLEDSSHYDFSIGLRLHGNMVAWQSGTPSLWITHDSRTKELTDTMALPSIGIHDFLEHCMTPQDARSRMVYDAGAYADRRSHLRGLVDRILETAHIKPVR